MAVNYSMELPQFVWSYNSVSERGGGRSQNWAKTAETILLWTKRED